MNRENKSIVLQCAKSIFCSVSVIVLLLTFVFRLAVVDGPSMNNTLKNGDTVVITNYQSFFKYIPSLELKQGDVVAAAPDAFSENEYKIDNAFIKRVIAIEGQTVGIDADKGQVYVDGKIINEPYISSKTLNGIEWDIPDVIPKGNIPQTRVQIRIPRSARIAALRSSPRTNGQSCPTRPPAPKRA